MADSIYPKICCLYNNIIFPSLGAPGEARTPNLLIRSQALCPIELRGRIVSFIHHLQRIVKKTGLAEFSRVYRIWDKIGFRENLWMSLGSLNLH